MIQVTTARQEGLRKVYVSTKNITSVRIWKNPSAATIKFVAGGFLDAVEFDEFMTYCALTMIKVKVGDSERLSKVYVSPATIATVDIDESLQKATIMFAGGEILECTEFADLKAYLEENS